MKTVTFRDCTVCRWEYYGLEGDEQNESTDVIGFYFRFDGQVKIACLTTSLFEVIIHYGTLEVDKDW